MDLTSLIFRNAETKVRGGIEKQRGHRGVDIVLTPERRSIFRRDVESEALAEKIVAILCENGATDRTLAVKTWNNNAINTKPSMGRFGNGCSTTRVGLPLSLFA